MVMTQSRFDGGDGGNGDDSSRFDDVGDDGGFL